jgi:hypothetical protein
MNTKKTILTLLISAVGTFGLAMAQQERRDSTSQPQQVEAAELDRVSAQPSLEQGILKLAAEKLRQEKRPLTTVEMPVTVKVTKSAAPFCWYQTCVYIGTKKVACDMTQCRALNTE